MRAVSQDAYGGPEVLHLVEIERPEPIPTEILVRVHAAGVNPVDWKTRAGKGVSGVLGEPPVVLGWDVAGVVEAVGFGVTRFAPGDEVMGLVGFPRAGGAYAEYVTAPSRQFARIPAGLGFAAAGALPLAGLTAWQALVEAAGVGPGQRVLVHAAAGGVGHLAVQIAKAQGAYVLGTASAGKHDFLRSLGVDEPIDYTVAPFEDQIDDVDVVLDLIGRDTGVRSVGVLRPGGVLISIPNPNRGAVEPAAARGVRVVDLLVEPDGHGLEQLAGLVDAGGLHVEVAEAVPLAEAARAHALGEAGRTRGKLVLVVD